VSLSSEVAEPARVTAALNHAVRADHLKALLGRYEVDLVIDVGAHHGQFATFIRDIGFEGRIVSYEPVSDAFAALEQSSATDSKWEVNRLALGSEDGTASINVANSTDFSSFLSLSRYGATTLASKAATVREERVPMRRLDSVLPAEVGSGSSFLKVDTQGWDVRVLEGATETLGRVVVLQVEVALRPIYDGMPSLEDVLAVLRSNGFEPADFFPVSHDSRLRLIEVDCIAVRA
jgi:FkbM family methyltransferase